MGFRKAAREVEVGGPQSHSEPAQLGIQDSAPFSRSVARIRRGWGLVFGVSEVHDIPRRLAATNGIEYSWDSYSFSTKPSKVQNPEVRLKKLSGR